MSDQPLNDAPSVPAAQEEGRPGLIDQFDVLITDATDLSIAAKYLAQEMTKMRDSLATLATDLDAHRKISTQASTVVSGMIDFMVGKA